MKERKRLIVLTSTFPRWDGDDEPTFIYNLCLRLKKYFDIHVLAPHYSGAATKEQLDGLQVTRFRYFFMSWERLAYQGGILANLKQKPWQYVLVPFFILSEFFTLVRLLLEQKFDLIHAHWLVPHGLVAVIARLSVKTPPPCLCTLHGGDLFGLQGNLFKKIKRLILSKSTVVTVVSRALRDEVMKLCPDYKKVYTIPMGVDLQNRFVPPSARTNKGSLLFVGRLVKKKGLRYLIDALPLILKRHPKVCLRIAGDGPEKSDLEARCDKLGINGHVRFLGSVKNKHLPALYQTSDVVVFPSVIADDGDQEGFGLVVVEALGCACATLVTDLPAMRDIIIDGKTGLVVPQKSIRRLAEKVVYLLDDPKLCRSLGKEGRRYVENRYDWNMITAEYKALIETISC